MAMCSVTGLFGHFAIFSCGDFVLLQSYNMRYLQSMYESVLANATSCSERKVVFITELNCVDFAAAHTHSDGQTLTRPSMRINQCMARFALVQYM